MELAADPAALQQWQTLRRLPPPQRLSPLAQAVEAHPNATVLAFGLLHSLRDGNQLGNQRFNLKAGALIPRQLWLLQRQGGRTRERDQRELHWLALHPGWSCAWLEASKAAIQERDDLPALVRAACSALNGADVRADLLRLALLWEHGGLSLDWDTRPQQSLATLVEPGTTLLLVTDHLGCLGLDAIGAIPRHPLVRRMLEEACRRVLQGEGFSRWELSGAALLSGAFARWLAPQLAGKSGGEHSLPAGVKVLLWSELQQRLSLGIPLSASTTPEQEPPALELINHRSRQRALRELQR